MAVKYHRHSAAVIRSARWKRLRVEALRRDGWQCVSCGASGRLEVDHINPVRVAPELAFDLANLQTLCPSCHTRKTRIECGHRPTPPARLKWRELVSALEAPLLQKESEYVGIGKDPASAE